MVWGATLGRAFFQAANNFKFARGGSGHFFNARAIALRKVLWNLRIKATNGLSISFECLAAARGAGVEMAEITLWRVVG